MLCQSSLHGLTLTLVLRHVLMDAYSKAWLQFVFPAYIWVLIGLMILALFLPFTLMGV